MPGRVSERGEERQAAGKLGRRYEKGGVREKKSEETGCGHAVRFHTQKFDYLCHTGIDALCIIRH